MYNVYDKEIKYIKLIIKLINNIKNILSKVPNKL